MCAGLLLALVVHVPAGAALVGVVVACGAGFVTLRAGRAGASLGVWALALAVAGLGWGGMRVQATSASPVPARSVAGVVQVDSQPQQSARGWRVRVRVVELSTRGVEPGTRLLLDLPAGPAGIAPGRRLRVRGRLGPAATARSPGWWRSYLARTSVAGRLQATTVTPAGRRGGLGGLRDRAREAASEAVGAGLSGERRAVVRGMALGGGAGLSEETAESFRDAGVWHLLAVSGQNVAMVAFAITTLLWAFGVSRRQGSAAGLVAIGVYCLVCDGGASVVRAGIMGALGVLALLRTREAQKWYLMLVGLTVLLIHQPRAIGDPGLQLSFAAVAGMFTLAGPIATWYGGFMPKALAGFAAQAAAATLATAPVVIWHFGELSLAGLVVNLAAVPLAAGIVVAALAGIAMGTLAAPLGVAVGWIAGMGAAVVIWLARTGAAIPGASVALPAWSAAIAAVVWSGVLVALRRLRAVSGPLTAIRPARTVVLAALAAMVAVLAMVIPVARPPEPWPVRAAVTALDIGQGDAILLRSPDGAAALFDTGPPGSPAPVRRALRRAGVRRLDLMAITHDQLDHSGAAPAILDGVQVGIFATPVAVPGLAARARARGVAVRTIAAGDVIAVGVWRLDVMWPPPGFTPPPDANDAALVILARAPGISALLTADAESDVLSRLRLVHVDVLKVSHHGSEDPGLADVLRRLTPSAALISVGTGNSYGHPVAATLATLADSGVRVARTDRSGTVTAVAGTGGVALQLERSGAHRP